MEHGGIHLGGETLALEQLAELMSDRCDDTIVYFGSCATTWVSESRLEDFRRQVGAAYVAGYRKEVDWVTAAAFEFIFLQALSWYSRVGDALNYLEQKDPRSLTKSLGFTRHPASNSHARWCSSLRRPPAHALFRSAPKPSSGRPKGRTLDGNLPLWPSTSRIPRPTSWLESSPS